MSQPEIHTSSAVSQPTQRSSLASTRREADPKKMLRRVALAVRTVLLSGRKWYLRRVVGMDIHPDTRISLKAVLDFTNPKGIHIDSGTLIAFNVTILSHDLSRVIHTDTYIGKNCFVGAGAIILPGVRVGDGCIVGSGAVVTKDVPPNSIVAGNPARVVRSGIQTLKWGMLAEAYEEAKARSERANSPEKS